MFPWRQFGRETLWGRRGLVKIGSLWLPLTVFLTLADPGRSRPMWVVCATLFAAAACRRVAGTLANDLADRADDRATGKTRWGHTLSSGAGAAFVAALTALGVGLLAWARVPAGAMIAYLGAVALVLGYSVPPLRCKERGALGLLVFSLSCVLLYVVTPWAWVGSGILPLAALSAAVFLDKWVNLHFHQVVDHAADRSREKHTYAVRAGPDRARRTLRWAANLASGSMAALLAVLVVSVPALAIPVLAVAGAALAGAWFHAWQARRSGAPSWLARELPWHYLGLAYAAFRIVPLLLLFPLAVREPALGWLFGLFGVLFVLESVYAFRYKYD
jgi:4-hydroxybenzoate polyprenyltransferase